MSPFKFSIELIAKLLRFELAKSKLFQEHINCDFEDHIMVYFGPRRILRD